MRVNPWGARIDMAGGHRRSPKFVALLLVVLGVGGLPQASPAQERYPPIRNVILMIGDGMGPQQVGLALQFARAVRTGAGGLSRESLPEGLHLERALRSGQTGFVQPSAHRVIVADSGCAATALASGVETWSESIGVAVDGTIPETVVSVARRTGRAAGLVSDTRLTHATPAAFGAHLPNRSGENEIARQLIGSGIEVMLSGGLRHFISTAAVTGIEREVAGAFPVMARRDDGLNLINQARSGGYEVVFDRQGLLVSRGPRLLGLFAASGMPDGIEEHRHYGDPARRFPALAEMTRRALELLERDPQGFFLMVEGGQIDWAAHANDAGTLLHEMLRFDRALGVILEWMKERTDTLLVITADHETGSFGFSYSGSSLPQPAPVPAGPHAGDSFDPGLNFVQLDVLARLYGQSRSLTSIIEEVQQRGPERLPTLLREHLRFSLSDDDVARVMEDEVNPYYVRGHELLGFPRVPKLADFGAFYPDVRNARTALIARALAEEQGVVWGTGTHTSTPVPIIAVGPIEAAKPFAGFHEQWEVGRLLQAALLSPARSTR